MLSTYIFVLCGSTPEANEKVGLAEAIQGICLAASALPVGWLATYVRRDKILRFAGGLSLAALGTTAYAVLATSHQYELLCAGLALWGLAQGSFPVVEALFADSIPTGHRTSLYSLMQISSMLAGGLGPAVAAVYFWVRGNAWSLTLLTEGMVAGMALSVIPTLALFAFNDSKALGKESEGLLENTDELRTALLEGVDEEAALAGRDAAAGEQRGPDGGEEEGDARLAALRLRFLCFGAESVPYIMCCSDLIMGMAAGMTIKFFPVWFKEDVGLSPSSINIVYTLGPLAIAIFVGLAERTSKLLGRVQTCILFEGCGVSLLFLVAARRDLWTHKLLCAGLVILRTGLMNAPYALSRSVLMDYVPKRHRAFWSSLESIAAFGWSGSAAIGGWLIKKHGYGASFHITAAMQVCAAALYLLLIPLVPRREDTLVVHAVTASGADNVNAAPAGASKDADVTPPGASKDGDVPPAADGEVGGAAGEVAADVAAPLLGEEQS